MRFLVISSFLLSASLFLITAIITVDALLLEEFSKAFGYSAYLITFIGFSSFFVFIYRKQNKDIEKDAG